jgi:ribonuclease T1
MNAWLQRVVASAISVAIMCTLLGGAVLGLAVTREASAAPLGALATVSLETLPPQVRETLRLIRAGGPFPYARDGVSFGNFEKRLPIERPHFYREYTVPTPGARDRGARRVIAGREGEFFYTDDHYSTFRRIIE